MAVEATVLDGDKGGGSERIEPGHIDRRFLDRTSPRDGPALLRDKKDGGII